MFWNRSVYLTLINKGVYGQTYINFITKVPSIRPTEFCPMFSPVKPKFLKLKKKRKKRSYLKKLTSISLR